MGYLLIRLSQLLLILVIAGCLAFSFFSASFGGDDHQKERSAQAQKAKITINEAIQSATAKVSGIVTKADLESEHGPLMWEIEIVKDNGEMVEVHINAEDGKIIDH